MKLFTKSIFIAATILSVSAGVQAGNDKILTDTSGMTLYTFDKDSDNTSVCYDSCATNWPPYIASDEATTKAGWGVIERKDGAKQWTYNNQPLYTWVGDNKAGDMTGDGVGGVWHTAKKSSAGNDKKSSGSKYDY